MERTGGYCFPAGISSKGPLTINNNAIIDSYDSTLGHWATQLPLGGDHVNANVSIESNVDITLGALVERHSRRAPLATPLTARPPRPTRAPRR